MRIDAVRLIGRHTIDLPMVGVSPLSRYILKAADGLSAPDVDVFVSKTLPDGGIYQNRRAVNRELVFRIGLNPAFWLSEAHGDLRDELYGLLNPGGTDRVQIQLLRQGSVVAVTSGWLKKFESVQFSKDPEVQLTISTNTPYLSGPEQKDLFSAAPNTGGFTFNYEGNAPAGFKIVMRVGQATAGYAVALVVDGVQAVTVVNPTPFDLNDKITIDTRRGTRSVTWFDASANSTKNALWMVSAASFWPEIVPGENTISEVPFNFFYYDSFIYTPRYWGV